MTPTDTNSQEESVAECRAAFEKWWQDEPISGWDGVTADNVWNAWQARGEYDAARIPSALSPTAWRDAVVRRLEAEAVTSTTGQMRFVDLHAAIAIVRGTPIEGEVK